MHSTAIQLVGRPVYPRLTRKPAALWERVAGDSAARALCEKLLTAGNDSQQRRAAVEELAARESSPTRVIDVSVLASQAFSVRQLEEMLAVLNDPIIAKLSAEIEKRARILFDSLLVGDTSAVSVPDLAHGGAMSNEVMRNLAREIPDVVQYLKIAELTNRELIKKLWDNPAFREEFIAERINYQKGPEVDRYKEELLADFKLLRGHLSPLQELDLFWSPSDFLGKTLTDKVALQYLWDQCRSTLEVRRFLTHDIAHTFAHNVINGFPLTPERRGYNLGMFLRGFCHLSLHFEHLKYVLAVNKYRLDGELPPIEDIPLARVVEAAAYAAGFRWRLPVNLAGEPKAGYINCLVEDGVGKAIHPAFLDIIIYNLIKNSIKAEIEAGKEEGNIRIAVAMKRDEEIPDAVVISVEDSAQGFNLERLLAAAKDLLEKPGNEGIEASFPVLEKIRHWRESPFSIRSFSVGELFDLAFVAKITGFSDKSISSGLGLFEVAEVAQLLGADVMMTNKYQGGARVDLILGTVEDRERISARELGY